MKILSMTAVFGKLDGQTLQLHDGLNPITAPNEWGKSTWCAFLTAMLYGIDTRERSTKDQIADKEKYLPWSGRPMEGRLRVIHQGRDITIQRRTRVRTPMGDFMAWETHTGLAVRELTAENCGQVLLGVEKSVFLRTGFLRFSDLPVRQDENLRRRLNSLVTTGDESGSAELLGGKLRELRNRCRHNQTGLIPECQAQIRELQEQLWQCQSLRKQHDAQASLVLDQETELAKLELHRAHQAWQDAEADRERIQEAAGAAVTARRLAKALKEKYTETPDREKLENQIRQGKQLLEKLELGIVEPPSSIRPIVLAGVLAVVLLIAALLMADSSLLIPCIILSIVMLLTAAALIGKRRRDAIWYNIERTRRQGKRDELKHSIEGWQNQLNIYEDLTNAEQNALIAEQQVEVLKTMARTADKPEAPDPLTLSREETLHALGEVTHQLGRSRMQLAQCRGRMEDLPDAEQLQSRLSQARRRLAELEKTYQAIGYAQNALESAMQELQRRFAPRIAQRAGYFLSRLTGGAYDRIVIGDDLTIQAARSTETTLRPPQWRSEGTGDQMYLALRLAVWEVLAPKCPIILDDALIRFDQARLEKAMELLLELGEKRQILLFSCQEREREYLMR